MLIFRFTCLAVLFSLINTSFAFCNTERNMLSVYISSSNELIVEGQKTNIDSLKKIVKSFILNVENDNYNAEKRTKDIKYIGLTEVSKGIVSIQCERNTTYAFYISVQNEIEKAYKELRNDLAKKIFGKEYGALVKKYQRAINENIPKVISEAEPGKL